MSTVKENQGAARNARKRRQKSKKPRIPKLHRPKRESTKTIVARLYKTWSAIVHGRANGRCEVCGAEGKNDAHHVQPRQICSGLRFDPRNGVCLCPSHHKYGHQSAHKGMLWFVDWFRKTRPEDYEFVMMCLDHELDCKNRFRLYTIEDNLHKNYGDIVGPMPSYSVVAYDRKGNKVESVVSAINNKAAEFIFWNDWPVGEEGIEKLKGIQKTEPVKSNDDASVGRVLEADNDLPEGYVAKLRDGLEKKGLIDGNGNAVYRQQLPTSMESAAIAIVQSKGAVE